MDLSPTPPRRQESVSLEERDRNGHLMTRTYAQASIRPTSQAPPMSTVYAVEDLKLPSRASDTRDPPMIILVLDASGSMERVQNDIRGSVNTFIDQQKSAPEDGTRLSLIMFNDDAKTRISKVPIQEVKEITPLDYRCYGSTALYDAIGLAIHNHSECKEALVVIVTDGEENTSRTSYDDICGKIDEHKRRGWSFIYLAAGLEVSRAGTNLGFHSADVSNATSATNNIAVDNINDLAPTLSRHISEATQIYRTTSEVPNLNHASSNSIDQ